MCVTDSLHCTPGMNTTLLINYTPIKILKKLKKNQIQLSLMRGILISLSSLVLPSGES